MEGQESSSWLLCTLSHSYQHLQLLCYWSRDAYLLHSKKYMLALSFSLIQPFLPPCYSLNLAHICLRSLKLFFSFVGSLLLQISCGSFFHFIQICSSRSPSQKEDPLVITAKVLRSLSSHHSQPLTLPYCFSQLSVLVHKTLKYIDTNS